MKLIIFIGLVIYYLFIAMYFAVELDSPINTTIDDNTKYNVSINISSIDVSEGSGFDIFRFLGFIAFGIGLPESTPDWISFTFALWQTLITIIFVIIFIMIIFGA